MLKLTLAAVLSTAGLVPAAAARPTPGEIDAVPYQRVTLGGSFWGPRLEVLRSATLEANRHQCDITGRLSNFDKAAKKIAGDPNPGEFEGYLYNDSDVYKMMEGWAYIIATETDPTRREELDHGLDALIARIAAAQLPEGYIDTYYTLKKGLDQRFTREEHDHETYCMGHLIEAGVAHYQATGKRTLLDVAIRAADYLRGLYGPDKFTAPPGHQELELALVRLAAATGQSKYSDFANELLGYRGHPHRKLDGSTYGPWGEYNQDHKPVVEQTEAAGHAVRAAYMYSAMADLARLGHDEYRPALESLWDDITQRRVFVTGGIGPSGSNEGFTVPFDIPTRSAYQETCASIALCLWAHRMFLLDGDARYMEQFERTLYNAALAGVSLDGSRFFYVNPLASRGGHARKDWYGCACCPPNVLRFFGELGQYVYAVRGDTVYVNLIMDSRATVKIDGQDAQIEQHTGYPFDGRVALHVKNGTGRAIQVAIRGSAGMPDAPVGSDGYARIQIGAGQSGGAEWEIPMAARRVYADPRVKASRGRVAIMRGPLVYAAESIDNGGDAASSRLGDIILPPTAALKVTPAADAVPTIVADAFVAPPDAGAAQAGLYRAAEALTPTTLTLRPYFMWANRGDDAMAVWLPESPAFVDPKPPRGVTVSASYHNRGDGLEALTDGIEPDPARGSSDESIPRFSFWPHKGGETSGPDGAAKHSEEWVRYDFDQPRALRRSSVYWFDDSGAGGCRVPQQAVLEYRDGEEWKPVPNGADGAISLEKDRANTTRFDEVVTTGLRLRIQLQDKVSAGILEWGFGR